MPVEPISPTMPDAAESILTAVRTFTIGAVGHRNLEGNPGAIGIRIASTLRQLAAEHADVGVSLLSSVAEGADRILLASAAELDIPYDCVLPCSPACFREDFPSQGSKFEFERLLVAARSVTTPVEPMDKECGYLWASEFVLDRADALIAVWNGAPGHGSAGTAETVTKALERGIPVIWITTQAPHTVRKLEPRAGTLA